MLHCFVIDDSEVIRKYTRLIFESLNVLVSEADGAVAAMEQAAIQASCETRRLWGQQAQGFAFAALPLCRGL